MRCEHIRIKDLGPFREVDLDLAAISGTLIAVTGDNGAGKSTLLELVPGALYRETRTRGSLAELARSRQAMVEVKCVNGVAYTVRQTVDAISGKGEALILNANGEPLSSGKVRDADAFVRDHFPASEVLYTSTFLAQQSEGFLELAPGMRKAVLLRLLQGGIEKLEGYAKLAREHATVAKFELDTSRRQLELLQKRWPRLEDAKHTLEAAEIGVHTWSEAVKAATRSLDQAKHWEQLGERAQEIKRVRAPIEARINMVEMRELPALRERVRNNRWLLTRAEDIRASVAELARLRALLAEAQHDHALAEQDRTHATERAGQLFYARKQAERALNAAVARFNEAKERCQRHGRVRRALAELPAAKAALSDAHKQLRELDERIEQGEELLRGGKDDRIAGLREGLETIVDELERKPRKIATDNEVAKNTLASDTALARKQARAPAALQKLRAERETARKAYERKRDQLDALKEHAAGAQDLERERASFESAKQKLAEATADHEAAAASHDNAKLNAQGADEVIRTHAESMNGYARAIATCEPKTQHADKLDEAQARLEEQERQVAQLLEQVKADRATLEQMPVPDVPLLLGLPFEQAGAHLQSCSDYLAQCEQEQRDAYERLTHAKLNVQTANEGAAFLADCELMVRQGEEKLENWTRLGLDCGRDGIQAYVIDAALPELNELANDLLHACFGMRFTIELRSSRESADGRRQLEDLSVYVRDTVAGFEGPAERYSGGQRVILGEAIALALTMLACRIAGLTRPTLVRDESGAALTPHNARAYLTMLRRAAEIVQADKVFFVTHNPELVELADARIEVGAGTAVVT